MSYLYETHLHTKESSPCGSTSAMEQVRAYKARGYQGAIITDHLATWIWRERKLSLGTHPYRYDIDDVMDRLITRVFT